MRTVAHILLPLALVAAVGAPLEAQDDEPVTAPARVVDVGVQSRLDRYHESTTDLEVIHMADRALADEVATFGPVYMAVEPVASPPGLLSRST